MLVFKIFEKFAFKIRGRRAFIVDGITNPKEGKKMPGVKLLHQDSNNNSKAEFVMAHACQCIALLIMGLGKFIAIPLVGRIHDGIKNSPNEKKTIIQKLIELLGSLGLSPSYIIADAYYACCSMVNNLIAQGHHLITRMRSNAVAWRPAEEDPEKKKKRGRPKKYGEKVSLADFFKNISKFILIASPFLNETNIQIQYYSELFFIRHVSTLVRIVFVIHPTKGRWILLSTDIDLDPAEVIAAYAARFKIEGMFKAAIHQIGAFAYHFWSMVMTKIKRGSGNQYLHRKDEAYREAIDNKVNSYNLYIQLGLIAQGLLLYISVFYAKEVWKRSNFWMRTVNEKSNPSEAVVSNCLRLAYFEFLANLENVPILQKFFKKNIDLERIRAYSDCFSEQNAKIAA
jgi:hypothetical protein